MASVLAKFKQEGVASVVFGDIFLEGVRQYREDNLARVGMQGVFPMWGRDTAELTDLFITLGFQAVITCVDTRVLDKGFIGRTLDRRFWDELPPDVDRSGENGEFHSFVFDGPIFREKISYTLGGTVNRDSFYFGDLLPTLTR